MPRPIVYRSLTTLTAGGFVEESEESTQSRGPQRTIVRATRRGRAALRRWLDTPVEHVRDVRTEFLVKVALLSRSGQPSRSLVQHQIDHLAPLVRAISDSADSAASGDQPGDGFDVVLARWRREQALAVDRFLHSLLADATP